MFVQGALLVRDCTPKVEKHLTCGQSFIPRRPVFCTLGPSEHRKSHKYEDFPRSHEWPRTCNNSESSGHREGSARRIRLIPRVVSRTKFQWHKPLFWGRRIYVSFVWTIHGGSCCYCSYPASRSLCCLSLSLTVLSLRTWFPHRPNLSSGKIEVEVRQSLASFLFGLSLRV